MLKKLDIAQVRFVALLAKAVRVQRDASYGKIPEVDFGEPKSSRGVHDATVNVGLEALPGAVSPAAFLREAVDALSEDAQLELHTLMRIGQGNLAAKTFHRGLSGARELGTAIITAEIVEDPDLHDHLLKAVYEAGLARDA